MAWLLWMAITKHCDDGVWNAASGLHHDALWLLQADLSVCAGLISRYGDSWFSNNLDNPGRQLNIIVLELFQINPYELHNYRYQIKRNRYASMVNHNSLLQKNVNEGLCRNWQYTFRSLGPLWASCQIHKIVGCSGNAGNVFPASAG